AVFDLQDCLITAPEVLAAWRGVLSGADFLPDAARLRGTIRVIHERPHFVLEGGSEWESLGEFLDAVPGFAAVWWQAEGRRRRLVADRRTAGEPGGSFAQVNPEMAARLQRDVIERVMHHAPSAVVDLF